MGIGIRELQGDIKATVLSFEKLNEGSDVSARQMVPAGDQQQLQRLARSGSTPIQSLNDSMLRLTLWVFASWYGFAMTKLYRLLSCRARYAVTPA